jgi:sugar lactone lactonase YvrE
MRLRSIIWAIIVGCLLSVSTLAHPGSGIAVDRNGQVFFLDTGSGLWKIGSRGELTHISQQRFHWLAVDPDDRFANSTLPTDPGRDWVLTKAATNPTVIISSDFPLVFGRDGNLYYPARRTGGSQIVRTSAAGNTTVFATLPNTTAGQPVQWLNGLAVGPDGSLYYTENNSIRRVDARGWVSTLATVPALVGGPSIPGSDDHPYLRGLSIGANGTIYVADSGDARVLKIAADGKITTVLQLESPWAPTAVAVYGADLYVLEFLHTPGDDRVEWMPRVRKITPDGRSAIILTVDQMPGARPRAVSKIDEPAVEAFHWEFLVPVLRQAVQYIL